MAWTPITVLFFTAIFGALSVLSWLAINRPETPRRGALGIVTTRGDRLFITLLGSAFIHLSWIALIGAETAFTVGGFQVSRLFGASVISIAYGWWVFHRV
jgi:predicted small integral membrane protein